MKKFLPIFAAAFSCAFAGTWEEVSLSYHSTGVNRTHCVIGPDGTRFWTTSSAHNLMSSSFWDPRFRTMFKKPYAGAWTQPPLALAASPRSDTVFVGGELGRVWKGADSIFTALPDVPNARTVNALAFDVYGKLWAATDSLAYQYNGTSWSPVGSASNYGASPITTHLAADPKGGMWIGSYGKGLLFHKQGAFTREFKLAVNTLQVMPSGTVLVGRYARLARIPVGSNIFETIDDGEVVLGDWSEGAYEDAYGGLWIGHVDEMAYRAPNGTWSAFGASVVGASSANGLYRFLQTADGSFYACGNFKTFRYTDKLAAFPAVTPDPETGATGVGAAHTQTIGFHISQRRFFLNAPGSHTVEFRAMDGALRADHIVDANTGLPMPQGLSVVRVKDAQGAVVLQAKVLN